MVEEAVGQFSEAGSKNFDGKEGPPRGELRYSTFILPEDEFLDQWFLFWPNLIFRQ